MEDHDPDGGDRLPDRRPAGDRIFPWTTAIGVSGLWIAAGFTLVTGYDYFRVGVAHLMDENK